MEWQILESQRYLEIMQRLQVGTIVGKVLDFRENQDPGKTPLHDYGLLKDAKKVLERLEKAIFTQEKVVVYGDYDCDGIMATSILVSAFERRHLKVGFHIPNRFVDGYGLSVARVRQMHEKGYTLIITVDNGISAFEACEEAKRLGMDVIITDHHEIGSKLPEAYAILHTGLSPDYPFKGISGGFLACKLGCALIGSQDAYFHCLAAISTISDVMPMVDENRTLVKCALSVMQEKRYLNFELLLGENQRYSTTSIGFTLVPKINSIGRLVDGLNPSKCVTYFRHAIAHDAKEREFKMQFASLATKINQSRQKLTTSQYALATTNMNTDEDVLFCYDKDFHEGLIGLVAGKLTKTYYRPSFVMHLDEEKGILKGSARSIAGINLYDLLKKNKDDLLVYGGHELAGGFSLELAKLNDFETHVKAYIDDIRTPDLFVEKSHAILLEDRDISLENVRGLEALQPFGQGNEEPTFAMRLSHPIKIETLSDKKHLKLTFELSHARLSCLWFNHGEVYNQISQQQHFELFGQISINQFRNFENIQLILQDLR
ncbi:Single-stranded-DNA-specific exonuclease RecJ [Clostridiales bacterium CHKCI006]|nr:Single-stranded-DNA-specific exonuclease RecJ [Clostridiales bacterium CHKCI006]